jgi:hypothetical protein
MSTRNSIKRDRDEGIGQGFHLYEDVADEPDCVMLDLEALRLRPQSPSRLRCEF